MNSASRVYIWLSVMLLAACEASPASRGDSLDPTDAEHHAPADASVVTSDDADTEAIIDAAEIDASEATATGDAEARENEDAGSDIAVSVDGSIVARDGGSEANGETLFVSVGGEDNTAWLYTSCDGRAWTRRILELPPGHPSAGEGGGLRGIGYGGGTFVITGGGSVNGGNVRLMGSSVDGVTWQWEQRPLSCSDCQWMGGAAFLDDGKDGVWIAGGGNGTRLHSKDGGKSWQTSTSQGIAPYRRFRSDGMRAVGAGQGVLTIVELTAPGASEPVVWRDSAQPIDHESVYVAAGNGVFVVVWYDEGCLFLRPGSSTFRTCELPEEHDPVLTSVVFGEGKFSILGRGAPIESIDGEHWTLRAEGTGFDFRDVTYAASSYVSARLYASDAAAFSAASPSALHGTAIAAGALGPGRTCPR